MAKTNRWTDTEDSIIREFRNGLMYKEMVSYLDERSECAIRNRALYLGLSKRNRIDLTLTGRKAQRVISFLYEVSGLPRLGRKWSSDKIKPILSRSY